MKYMMFVIADPAAAAEAEPNENDWTIEQWLADVEGRAMARAGEGGLGGQHVLGLLKRDGVARAH